jgi:hypothetical protein
LDDVAEGQLPNGKVCFYAGPSVAAPCAPWACKTTDAKQQQMTEVLQKVNFQMAKYVSMQVHQSQRLAHLGPAKPQTSSSSR